MPKPRTVVVGGGFGGLAAAIRLQTAGHQVTLLEKRDRVGGRAYVYQDKGFVFDAGPTVITAPDCLRELFAISGRRLEDYVDLLPVDPLYRLYWEDGFRFDYTRDLDQTLRQIKAVSPSDVENYRRFLDYTRQVFDEGYTKLAHVPFLNWSSMIRVAPQLLRLKAYRSVYDVVSSFILEPHLRQAFSFHSLLVGGNPFSTSAIYTLIHFLERKWGVYFPKGGTGALVDALARLFRELGGEIRVNSEIEEILVDRGHVSGVKEKSGFVHPAEVVVSNADVNRTYCELLREVPAAKRRRRSLQRASYSMSLFVLYFGTNRRFDGIQHHNILFCQRYKELLQDIFHGNTLPEDFSLYLHAPTMTDASLAPPGCESFYVLSPVPHLGNVKIDWTVEGPRYAQRILDYLEERYLPGLKDSIITQRHFTPLDFKEELNSHLGSAFSLKPTLTQSAYFRVHNQDPSIGGLFFVGAGTHPGAGVPGVVASAKATAGLILDSRRAITSAQVEACYKSIESGSLSFSLASRFFSREARQAASFLYAWCRYCDDKIDQAANPRVQKLNLEEIRKKTQRVFEGEELPDVPFIALKNLAEQYGLPRVYSEDLLAGMEMDVNKEDYWSFDELLLYAYRVAGTVGLMMCHVMRISNEEALKHARDLGIAMQLTNIARDVLEDFKQHRIYLPLDWLDSAELDIDNLDRRSYRRRLHEVVSKLLRASDAYYASGQQGLKYLPLRCAWAVAAASAIYREIGVLVLQRGENAWDVRTVVPLRRKLVLAFLSVWTVIKTIPYRLRTSSTYKRPNLTLRYE